MDYFVFSMGFNLANMTLKLVELGSFSPVLPISTSWNVKFAKLKSLSLELGCLVSSLQYPNSQGSNHRKVLAATSAMVGRI